MAGPDPWAKLDAWRDSPKLQPSYNMRRMFPGLLIGAIAAVVVISVETVLSGKAKAKPSSGASGGH